MKYNKILLIDDNEDDCEIFLFAIQKAFGHRQYPTLNQAEIALEQLEQKQLLSDHIFLCLNMPVMKVMQYLPEIKKRDHLKDISVIILSTSLQSELIGQTKLLGVQDFIKKPTDFNNFVKVFNSTL